VVLVMRRTRPDERGVVAIMFAVITCFILFGVAALVVDLGLARDTKQASQIASDASALAAANVLYPTSGVCKVPVGSSVPCIQDAVAAAKEYAEANYNVTDADWSKCTAPPSGYTAPVSTVKCVSFDSVSSPTKVWAAMPVREVNTGFGVMAGVTSVPVAALARATIAPSASVTCGLCFLGSINATKFNASVSPGGVAVNGSVQMSGNGSEWTAATIAYTGTFDSNNKIDETGTLSKIPAFSDPWASKAGVPPAIPAGYPTLPANTNPCTGGPGVYGAYEFKHACTFATGGLYVVTDAWTWKNITVTAPGVTIYVTPNGWIDTKNGDLKLTAPTTGSLAGLGIIYDRNNSHGLFLQGNGNSSITGAIYAPASNWYYNGTSDLTVTGGPVILKSMTGNGTTGVKIISSNDAEALKLPGEISLDR
jgi:hypothetical protein